MQLNKLNIYVVNGSVDDTREKWFNNLNGRNGLRPLQLDCWYISKRYCYRSTVSWQWCQKRPKVRRSSL